MMGNAEVEEGEKSSTSGSSNMSPIDNLSSQEDSQNQNSNKSSQSPDPSNKPNTLPTPSHPQAEINSINGMSMSQDDILSSKENSQKQNIHTPPAPAPDSPAPDDTKTPDTSSMPSHPPQPPPVSIKSSQSDWHMEQLCGLFLRSDEQELEQLEQGVAAQRTSIKKGLLKSDIMQPPACSPGGIGESKEGVSGIQEETGIADCQAGGSEDIGPLHKDHKSQDEQFNTSFLVDLLNLENSMDSSVLSLIPEALRGINTKKKQEESDIDIDFDNPLRIPSSWRRPDYAQHSLHDIEHQVVDSGKGETGRNDARAKSTVNPTSHIPLSQGPKKYELFTLLYNECSLAAMANWAMLDYSAGNHGPNGEDCNTKEESWEEYKKTQQKQRASDKSPYQVMVPPATFHLCAVCKGFGHYEAECELLLDGDVNKRSRAEDRNDSQVSDESSPKKKARTLNSSGGSTQDVVLDINEKNRVVSSLSKEIHVQRRQLELYEHHCMKMNENDIKTAAALAVNDTLTGSIHDSKTEEEDDDEEEYIGTSSYCCQICRSSIDDGVMLLCDGCDCYCHMGCLDPPLSSIPEGDWFCSNCISHDSDASSILDVEGCGEFVFEQRKRDTAEKARQYFGIGLGHSRSPWDVAWTVLSEQDLVIKDESYFKKHLDRENARSDFFIGELCWAKKFDDALLRMEWWPAMVTDSETRTLKSSNKTTYTVAFFADDEEEDVHETEILPFLPYYEGIGHNRRVNCGDLGLTYFHHALMLCVSALGIKSLGQALKVARDGVPMTVDMNDEHRKALPPGWKAPAGWESADFDTIDGIMIFSKDGSSGEAAFSAALDSANTERTSPRRKRTPSKRPSPIGSNTSDAGSTEQDFSANQKMVAQFSIDEVVGSIVSWQFNNDTSSQSEKSNVQYGVVVSIDMDSETALVRMMPMLSEASSGNLDDLFNNDSKDLIIHATHIGSSIRIPLKLVRFVSGKPGSKDLAKFTKKLKSSMNREMKRETTEFMAEARYREEFSVELEDLPNQGPYL